jgi:putative effector of murein hydrolase LrgA (UPF0299 family)
MAIGAVFDCIAFIGLPPPRFNVTVTLGRSADQMLQTLGLLLGCQLVGEFVARGLGLPIPGPVFGLVILLAALALRPPLARALRPTTLVVLAHLSLMFVPAGVGVISNLEVLSSDWARLLMVLTLSTILSMLVTVTTFIAMKRLIYRLQK